MRHSSRGLRAFLAALTGELNLPEQECVESSELHAAEAGRILPSLPHKSRKYAPPMFAFQKVPD
jgi:hypothetical protein